jgi:hypothetical protein
MRIGNAVKRILSLPNGWVRVEQIRRIPTGLELCLGVHQGRRGRRAASWQIRCLGVREFQIADVDGGGLALYSGIHPAARQFTARQAILRWSGCDAAAAMGAVCQAHIDSVFDWIPVDRYVDIWAIAGKKFVCRGPDFLLRAYAKRLRLIGAQSQLRLRAKRKSKKVPPRVLHFGNSFVVAITFIAQPQA